MKKSLPILLAAGLAIVVFSLPATSISADRDVIVGFHQSPGPSEQALIHGLGGGIRRAFHLIPAVAARLPEQALAALQSNPRVAYVESDATVSLIEPLPGETEYDKAWGVSRIGSEAVHGNGILGAGARVAVIDSGIDYNHPDLGGNYMGGYDFVFNDADPFDDSYNSHGTHVAGIVAAELNGLGVVGVAPEASLYAVKVVDGGGFGIVSWIIAGIEWAVMNGMDIANMSIGLQAHFQSLQDECDAAYDAGLILVAAAGNYAGGSHGPVMYPAAYESVIAVSATLMDDTVAFFSAVGPEVELAAPGAGIYSTVAGGGYGTLFGTSQASPHVAGVAALLLSSGFNEDLNGDGFSDHQDVRLQMQVTAQDLGDPGWDDTSGYGLVRADAALFVPPPVTHLDVTKGKGSPADSAQTVFVSGVKTKIEIVNDSLSKMDVDVYEGGSFLKDLSQSYRFGDDKPSEVELEFEDYATTFEVVFVPRGKQGAFADVYIQER